MLLCLWKAVRQWYNDLWLEYVAVDWVHAIAVFINGTPRVATLGLHVQRVVLNNIPLPNKMIQWTILSTAIFWGT